MERFESLINNVDELIMKGYDDPDEYNSKLEILAKTGNEEHVYEFIGPGVSANIFNRLNRRNMELSAENEKLKEELHSLKNLKKSNLPETPITDTMLVDDYLKLVKENEKLTFEKEMIKKGNDKFKKELSLEKAANEAQHKFILEYADNGVEILFNYAIDEVKEVTYVIVDAEKYNKYREKWANVQVEQDCHKNTRADILDQAKECVCGHREQDYGTPESNFQLIADLWNGYLGFMDHPRDQIRATDVAMMMALMKIARIRNGGGSGDSFVDLAGYAACGGEIWHGERHSDK